MRCAASLLLLAGPLAAGTFVVDDDGGFDFTDVPPALAVAQPGDLVLVRDGQYSAFVLDEGVAVLAAPGHAPHWDPQTGTAWVRDVPAGQVATLAGLALGALRVQDCAGTVVVDDCELQGFPLAPALSVKGSARVVVARTSASGHDGTLQDLVNPWYPAQPGADLRGSTVLVSQSVLQGGRGGTAYKGAGLAGAPGAFVKDATCILQASSARGGHGGPGWDVGGEPWVADGGDGAPGVLGQAATLGVFGSGGHVLRGGAGGDPNIGSPGAPAEALHVDTCHVDWSGVTLDPASPAPPIGGAGSVVTEVQPAVPVLATAGTGLLGQPLELSLAGAAGAAYALWVAPAAAHQPLGTKPMPLLLDPGGLFLLAAGALDDSGAASLALAVPDDDALQGLPVHLQAFVKPVAAPSGGSTAASLVLR